MISGRQLRYFVNAADGSTFDTPYMLTDLDIVRSQCRLFRENFPSVKLLYAMKSFSDLEVITALDDLVDGYDVASIKEIRALIGREIAPERLAFGNPVKSTGAIKEATTLGVNRFAFQSRNELTKIADYAPGAQVYVRVMMGDSEGAIPFSSKFGCSLDEAIDLLKVAAKMGLNPVGITFHVGSQAKDLRAWSYAVDSAQQLVDKAAKQGILLDVINIGGGFPVEYSSDDPRIQDIASEVNEVIHSSSRKLTYMAEPGRFLVADSSVIVTTVIGVEKRLGRTWLYLDVGTFQAFMEVFEFHDFPYPVYSLRHLQQDIKNEKYDAYVLTGPSCDSYDTMALHVELPGDINVGDKLVVCMAGAYTVVYGSTFNGFAVPPRHFLNI